MQSIIINGKPSYLGEPQSDNLHILYGNILQVTYEYCATKKTHKTAHNELELVLVPYFAAV